MSEPSELGTADSWPRRALHSLVGPAALDFWAARLSPDLSWQQPLARVVARDVASADAVTLTLRPNRHWQGLRAGQHITVSVEVDGRRLTRPYSPSVVDERRGLIAITVRRDPEGRVSRRLCDATQPGDVLPIGQAFGALTLGAAATPRMFLAAGSGITPLMAMLREWANSPRQAPLALGYWARRRDELCFVDELRALAQTNPRFRLRFFLTGEPPVAADEGSGRIDLPALATLDLPQAASEVSTCGPDGFVAAARSLLAGNSAAFRSESFTPATPPADIGGTARITLARRGQSVEVPRGQSLLDALEALGVSVVAGCRRGICHTCSCAKREGSSRDLRDGSVSNEPASALQLCVNAALGDLVLDL